MDKEYIEKWAAINALTAEALERNLDRVPTDDAGRYHRAAERVIAGIPAADVRENVIRTKADRIRAMSDEELASIKTRNLFVGCPPHGMACPGPPGCYQCWLNWLKSPEYDKMLEEAGFE